MLYGNAEIDTTAVTIIFGAFKVTDCLKVQDSVPFGQIPTKSCAKSERCFFLTCLVRSKRCHFYIVILNIPVLRKRSLNIINTRQLPSLLSRRQLWATCINPEFPGYTGYTDRVYGLLGLYTQRLRPIHRVYGLKGLYSQRLRAIRTEFTGYNGYIYTQRLRAIHTEFTGYAPRVYGLYGLYSQSLRAMRAILSELMRYTSYSPRVYGLYRL